MTDIAELFARDPNSCTDQDIMLIIQEFRSKQHLFRSGIMTAGSTKPKAVKAPATKLDLSDLGL